MIEVDEEMTPLKKEDRLASSKKENFEKRLRKLDEKVYFLREKAAKVEKAIGTTKDSHDAFVNLDEKEEIDCHSIFVGNVDYVCSPEEVQQHFQSCGTINRVKILANSLGQPKGYAYVEFVEVDAAQNALLLNETELHGRPLRVLPKRINIPGMKQSWVPFGYGSVGVCCAITRCRCTMGKCPQVLCIKKQLSFPIVANT
ncbi:polyadenylate-binding protein 3-like isoform X2 [Phoenix dactylifera]|uniref:Polyadenylate-binding protein 3-like isoform X2 n=1 Tax=Phoenix dactylifera TaxID=42345 RepID=A0A8B8ZBS9_PHODC|nr:polyadenylate-binding protein 3-like isoform X2 [Phoenix dactylifera]